MIWGIHGGRTGDANHLFLGESVIALGWPALGDLSAISPTRDALKSSMTKAYPHMKPGAVPVGAGQLFRFISEAKNGEFVAYPSQADRHIHIGKIESDYFFDERGEAAYPNRRRVTWLKSIPRTAFTQGALYEIGSAMSFFQIRNYADEFIASVQSTPSRPAIESDEASVKVIAAEVQESTHDFVLKRLAQELKGHPFADFVAHLLGTMGYRSRVSPPGADGGVDILVHRDELGFEPPIIKVQVKSSEDKVGDPTVKSLYGNVDNGEYGLFVSLGSFSPSARAFERTKSNLRLIDGVQLVDLILEHYDQLDPQYKGLMPLKRVFVPQPVDDDRGPY